MSGKTKAGSGLLLSSLLDWAIRLDFVASHLKDYGWFALVSDFFAANIPTWLAPTAAVIGLLLIWRGTQKDNGSSDGGGGSVGAQSVNQSGGQTAHTIINEAKRDTYSGKISAQNGEVLFSSSSAPLRRMEIGDSGANLVFAGSGGGPLISFFDKCHLTIEVIDGELKVSTRIFDKTEKLIAELVRNEWKVAPPPKTWDRNYSRDALEVINDEGDIVLQVKVLPDRVQIQGEWRGNGGSVRLVKSDDPHCPGGLMQISGPDGSYQNATPIKKMFVYPSDNHIGELNISSLRTITSLPA